MKRKKLWLIPVGICAVALFVFAGGELVKVLWNWLLPPLFGWHEVTFWQALGLLALCRILFGGFGKTGPNGPKMGKRKGHGEGMSPEEREGIRQRLCEEPAPSPSEG